MDDKPGNAIILAIFIKRNVDFSEIEFSGRSILESQKACSIPSKYGEREMSINQNRKEEEIHERLLDL